MIVLLACADPAPARTIYRCERDGSISMATAPEPGSRCMAYANDENSTLLHGLLYQSYQNGQLVYSTRNLAGSVPALSMAPDRQAELPAPPPLAVVPPHVGLGRIGKPRIAPHSALFADAARSSGIEDAWLRAIAHAESDFRADAVSPKGAQGVMQLMPATALAYRVKDPFSPGQSIRAGAKYLASLLRRYKGDRRLAAAAYNAGVGAVARYKGIPPYAETRTYVAKVDALFELYADALPKQKSRPHKLETAN